MCPSCCFSSALLTFVYQSEFIHTMDIVKKLVIVLALLTASSVAQECQLHDSCVCEYDDGQGYDLRPVVTADNFLEAFADANRTFYYHPCGDTVKLPKLPDNITNECVHGYMLCMFDKVHNKTVVLGKQANMEFKPYEDQMQMLFTKTEQQVESSILLECAPQSKVSVLYAPLTSEDGTYNLVLYSKHGCKEQVGPDHHHGFFYILFIILLTLLFAYLFLGIMVNYFFVGARGYELIPNYDFWCKAWTSAKLFFIYVKNGCRVIPSEDTYDAI